MLADQPGVRLLDDDEKARVLGAYREYLETIPAAKRQQSLSYEVKDITGRSGFGIGSAGLQAYTLLVEGKTQALENDVVLSMKQAQTPAASRVVTDEKIRSLLRARGPPDGGLPGRAAGPRRPVGGLVLARRRRPGDQGALALRGRPRLGRRDRDGRDGAAGARPRPRDGEGPLRLRRGLRAPARGRQRGGEDHGRDRRPARGVRARPGGLGRGVRRADARGPPPLRRRLPQRDDPRAWSPTSGASPARSGERAGVAGRVRGGEAHGDRARAARAGRGRRRAGCPRAGG